MDPFTIGFAASSLSAAVGWWSKQEQASAVRQQTQEELRRLKGQQEAKAGQALADGAASGVEVGSGSLQAYLSSMAQEFRKQSDWMSRAGQGSASALAGSANLDLFTDLGGALFRLGQGQGWGK